jgi:methylmalonyl-CoA mutase N-terminal domain/subunit
MAARKRPAKTPKEAPKPNPRREPKVEAVSGRTLSGVLLPPVADRTPPSSEDYLKALGFPGEPPFTRGIRATMYRGRLWTMRQYAGFGTAKETNRRFKYLFAQGNEGLSVAFDLPTQMGYDSDAPLARGEVGRVGVAISTLEDMGILFEGLPLDRVSTSMTINATAPILLALYIAVAESQGISRKVLRGTVQNDILKEYIARSTYIYPPAPSMRLALDVIAFCSREVPRWNAISVSGYHIREAGATAAQEIAFALADGIAYLEAAKARGLDIDGIAPQISFFFNAHIDLLEEVAKFRAARRLWAKLVAERFHPKNPESLALRFHAQTAGVALTAQQPENNAVRVAIQALAAVLGGAQSLHTNSMDEALSLPSERAVRLALRTQQLLAHESGVANTADPSGGAFAIESLTDRIEGEAADLVKEVDRRGGMLKAIEVGWVQAQIADSAYRYQMELERDERIVVGVNAYAEGGEQIPISKVNPKLATERSRTLEAFRKGRDSAAADRGLRRLEEVARSEENTMPAILDAIRAKVTLGEISDVLRGVFGTYRQRQDV